jgi:hypothetical protein
LDYNDEALLKIVGEERKRSIGFGESTDSGELTGARQQALAYAKGRMADVPAMANRSAVVDTTVADAIETVLPDVLEIFVGGDDVATFIPQGEEDEDKAQEETDFVTHVIMTENEGFLVLYSAIKDAVLTRTGIFHWWWDEEEKQETQAQVPAHMAEMAQAIASMQGHELQPEEQDDGSISLKSTKLHGKVKIKAFPSEDFSCASDTVSLRDATYCVVRDRPRVQELIARGIDAEKARELKSYDSRNDAVEHERDQAGEHNMPNDSASGDLRTVEVRAHYIRLGTGEDGKLEIWRVLTDAQETVLLDKEKVSQIPFAALTPYIIPHRFYGESVADKLIEVQKIKTVLLRSHLDSVYFGLNQRVEVDMSAANEFTIADLLRNEPGVPVRVKSAGALKPISAGLLNVDTLASLEYASTLAESRSGIVRNAQGLNPDTLHDTAKGAMALISAAQKRVRLIARIFAETGIKDLFLGVHALLREGYTDKHAPAAAKLRNKWATVQPNTWPERCAMSIHVGVGSAGKEHEIMVAGQRLEIMQELVTLQGGIGGPLVDGGNVHNALTDWERAAGSKKPDAFWSDPANAEPQQPKPDPEMEKAKAELALKQQTAQADQGLAREQAQATLHLQSQKHEADAQAAERKAARDHELAMTRVSGELQLKRETTEAELQMKRELLTAELQMKREVAMLNAQVAHETGMAKAQASGSVSEVEPGGEPG